MVMNDLFTLLHLLVNCESDLSVLVHHVVVVVIELTCWLLSQCIALTRETHSFELLVAHERYMTVAISVPLSICVIYFYHMAWILSYLTLTPIERSRSCRHQSASPTHFPILHGLVLHNLELQLLLLLVHLHIYLVETVGINLQSLTPTPHLFLLV